MLDQLQRPLRDLRLSIIDRCNFRCPYCMPAASFGEGYRFLRSQERLNSAEFVRLTRLFLSLGVEKLRITGGEPLLYNGIGDLIGDLTALPGLQDVALTTNGVLLAQHAAELKAAGLQRVTVSLDSLDDQIFATMAGGMGRVADVLAGVVAAQAAGLSPIKVNAVVQRGVNDAGMLDLIEHFRFSGVVVRMIEYMDVGNRNQWDPALVVGSAELLARIQERWALTAVAPAYRGEVARRYRFNDGGGEIGFISSVSQPFCGQCTRARLSSDGRLYTCLFASTGLDLRGPMRAGAEDEDLLALIRSAWQARTDRYSEQRMQLRARKLPHVEMNHVGG